ncbi:hypothetical protein I546_4625 [Mycobacterium kansasii 732]|nr:hypothetical protein I546_4625 [Mycobacterium kansasii 732]
MSRRAADDHRRDLGPIPRLGTRLANQRNVAPRSRRQRVLGVRHKGFHVSVRTRPIGAR